MVSDAVRDEEWAFAQMLVSSAAPRKVRRGLARVLIPAAVEANATEVAWRVVVDCGLTSEYPHVEELKVGREPEEETLACTPSGPSFCWRGR